MLSLTQKIKKNKGFTLLELLISMTIGLFLVAMVAILYGNSHHTYQNQKSLSKMQESARFGADILRKEIQMAGHLPGCVNEVTWNTNSPFTNTNQFYPAIMGFANLDALNANANFVNTITLPNTISGGTIDIKNIIGPILVVSYGSKESIPILPKTSTSKTFLSDLNTRLGLPADSPAIYSIVSETISNGDNKSEIKRYAADWISYAQMNNPALPTNYSVFYNGCAEAILANTSMNMVTDPNNQQKLIQFPNITRQPILDNSRISLAVRSIFFVAPVTRPSLRTVNALIHVYSFGEALVPNPLSPRLQGVASVILDNVNQWAISYGIGNSAESVSKAVDPLPSTVINRYENNPALINDWTTVKSVQIQILQHSAENMMDKPTPSVFNFKEFQPEKNDLRLYKEMGLTVALRNRLLDTQINQAAAP